MRQRGGMLLIGFACKKDWRREERLMWEKSTTKETGGWLFELEEENIERAWGL